ncbi:phosphoserine phosphatase-like [Ptychodera flava]|uniref:phosphoserine phosphatase-like n=1 Tax=Ptychodera flava TaxID=63121 RepID=UPI00396A826A
MLYRCARDLVNQKLRRQYTQFSRVLPLPLSQTIHLKSRICGAINTMATLDETKDIWKKSDAVCFDVDSTVVIDEGIDELAAYLNKGKEVAAWTVKAMDGTISYRETLRARLEIIQPSRQSIETFVKEHPPRFTKGVQELIKALHARDCHVYLISGGLRSIIEPMAKILDIPNERIYCNRLKFYFNGKYAGFDEDQPTSREGGKPEVVRSLKKQCGYKNLVMIGDGATDLEAWPPADAFIGFGGNQVRPKVKEQSKWFVNDFAELTQALKEN